MPTQFKYYAFISYNSKDTAWGKKLQKKLEHYKPPIKLCREHELKRTPIRPVFFAPTDIQPGGLTEEIQKNLKVSKNLIVICSPNSAQSEWVSKEIEFFHKLRHPNNIHFFIVDGIPHSGKPETECFSPIVDQLGLPEILGANIHEKIYRWPWLNRERAYVQLISKLLGVEFDAIWQRHKRQMILKYMSCAIGITVIVCALFGIWHVNRSENVVVKLNEISYHNENLPPLKDAIVTMSLNNETKSDTIYNLDCSLTFNNIPHRYLNHPVHFSVSCQNHLNTDTTMLLTHNIQLNIFRDPTVYGDVHFRLWNPEEEKTVANEKIKVGEFDVVSDKNGFVSIFIPLEKQQKNYCITASFPLVCDTIYMPCGKNDVILVQ